MVCDFGIFYLCTEAEEFGEHSILRRHADYRGNDSDRITRAEGTLLLPARNVVKNGFEDRHGALAMLLQTDLMPFESGEEENALRARIAAVTGDHVANHGAEQARIVIGVHQGLPFLKDFGHLARLMGVIENRVVQSLLVRE